MSPPNPGPVTVYFDGACPICRKEVRQYDRWALPGSVRWVDITDHADTLRELGITPEAALLELHLRHPDGRLERGLDAFITLWARIPWCRPLAWVASLAPVHWLLRRLYRWHTRRRLARQGRLPQGACRR
ncbi:thiol-disulfide oxidoreductase DCC family protein [Motiliproteus sp. SC1-56]|uniref:thiol-disulfide oxidoreductase DCC family protein n=1 Tax=Motiliproteus sp. SC1-56 TaxID=2799565 RepID=UPI001A9017E5|nr:DUF393 domain-containing protein [Motiliproteus sp. SC1-56]